MTPERKAEIEAHAIDAATDDLGHAELRDAIRELLAERERLELMRVRLANVLPDDVRAMCLDEACRETIGSLVGRTWDEAPLPEPPHE